MIKLAADPRFAPAHACKVAAIANTLATPVSPGYAAVRRSGRCRSRRCAGRHPGPPRQSWLECRGMI